MREIVSLHVGRCGAGMGAAVWDGMAEEHGLDEFGRFVGCSDLQLSSIGCFFDEVSSGRYVPRSVFCDLDPDGLNFIKSWPVGRLFRPENFVVSETEASNNFAKGYTLRNSESGLRHFRDIIDSLRREFETSDSVQAVHITHSLGGGTGSGVTSLVLESLADEFNCQSYNFSLFPSPISSEVVVESYNTVLAMPSLIEHSSLCFSFDNTALGRVSSKVFNCEKPGVVDANKVVAMLLLGLTACTRFPGQLNVGINKLKTALVPLPRLHFLVNGLSMLGDENFGHQQIEKPIKEIANRILSPNTMTASCNFEFGTAITAAAIFRGRVSMQSLETAMMDMRAKKEKNFPLWLQHNLLLGACDIPPRGDSLSAAFTVNHSSLMHLLKQQCAQVEKMFSTGKAFFHLYEEAGITEDAMQQAISDTETLVVAYAEAAQENHQLQTENVGL